MTYEFGSQTWLAALHGIITERVAQLSSSDPALTFSMCEVFTDAPPELANDGTRIVWSCVVTDGAVDFRQQERDDVGLKVVMDYATCLPLGGYDTRGDLQRVRELRSQMRACIESGRLIMTLADGGAGTMPGVHDAIARLTHRDPGSGSSGL